MIYIINPKTAEHLYEQIEQAIEQNDEKNKTAVYIKSIKNADVIPFIAPFLPPECTQFVFEDTSIKFIQQIINSFFLQDQTSPEQTKPKLSFYLVSGNDQMHGNFNGWLSEFKKDHEDKIKEFAAFNSTTLLARHLAGAPQGSGTEAPRGRSQDSKENYDYPVMPTHPTTPDNSEPLTSVELQRLAHVNHAALQGNVANGNNSRPAVEREYAVCIYGDENDLDHETLPSSDVLVLPRLSGQAVKEEELVRVLSLEAAPSVGPSGFASPKRKVQRNILAELDAAAHIPSPKALQLPLRGPVRDTNVEEMALAAAIQASLEGVVDELKPAEKPAASSHLAVTTLAAFNASTKPKLIATRPAAVPIQTKRRFDRNDFERKCQQLSVPDNFYIGDRAPKRLIGLLHEMRFSKGDAQKSAVANKESFFAQSAPPKPNGP